MWRVFMHADAVDYALMTLGFLGAIGDGISIPVTLYFASSLFNDVGSGTSITSFDRNTSNVVVLFLYVAAGSLCFAFLEGYCWTQTGERQASRMRTRYLRAVLRQDVGYFDLKGISTAEVVNGVSNDSMVIQDFLSEKVPNFIMHSSTFFASYVVAFVLMWRLVIVVFPTALLLIIPGLTYSRVLLNLARMKQVMYTDASEIAEQAVSSIRTVYASTAEHRVMSAFNAALANSTRIGTFQGLVKGLAVGSTGITFAIWALMVWYSSRLIMFHGAPGGSAFVAGITIVNGGLSLGSSLTNVEYLGEAAAAAQRIYEVIMRRPLIDSESSEGDVIGEVEGEVEFRMVRFAYPVRPDTEVLKGFSLRVAARRKVALVGESGSGKSTAIALLQRFYDPAGGEILLDGIDTRRLKLKWLRQQMGLVSQEPALFATSIKENILFGKEDATLEEVVAAIEVANASVFISQLPLGIDTQVGERGVQLSGGQKQRIAIARAIIRSPKILLLDEATSALDSESEHVVQDAINSAANDCTTIIVAHRLSTIRNADSIAFVHAGQVIELGSHNDLIRETGSHYSSLVRLQESQTSHDASETDTLTISPSIPQANHKIHCAGVSNSISISPNQNHNPVSKSDRSVVEEDVKFATPIRPSFWQLLMLNAPEWRQATLGCIGAILVGAVQPLYGVFVGNIVSIYFVKDNDKMKEQTGTYSLLLVGLSMFCFIVNLLQHSNFAIMGEYLTKRVREKMLSKMLTFEVGWFDQEENSSGRICSRLAQDASAVRSLVGDRMALVIQTLSAVVISYTTGILIAWRLALVIISVQPIVILCIYARFRLLKTMSKKAIKAQSKSSELAAEAINNLRNITTFSSQGRILRLFKLAQVVPHSQGHRQSWLAGFGLGLSKCISIGNLALAFWYGSRLVVKGYISRKDYFQTLLVLINTGRLIAESGSLTTDITKGVNSVSSVFSILNRAARIDPKKPDSIHPESLYGDIELQNVEFSYPTRPDVPVMCNFSLSIKASTSTALVGQSGSGKSTVISLIERFYDPLHGAVYIDGKDIRTYKLRSLRRLIGLVGQEPVLFDGSVRDNIMFGIDKCINDAELEAAARVANAHDFICSLTNGYQTSCGRNGMQLSGGQKQRIAIARAVLRNPRILLLDEATSALDGQSEKLVQEAMDRVMVGRTSVVVAHRLSTVKNCDVIAVVEKGVLVEKGSHASLMAKGHTGKYFGLVSLQSEVKTTYIK